MRARKANKDVVGKRFLISTTKWKLRGYCSAESLTSRNGMANTMFDSPRLFRTNSHRDQPTLPPPRTPNRSRKIAQEREKERKLCKIIEPKINWAGMSQVRGDKGTWLHLNYFLSHSPKSVKPSGSLQCLNSSLYLPGLTNTKQTCRVSNKNTYISVFSDLIQDRHSRTWREMCAHLATLLAAIHVCSFNPLSVENSYRTLACTAEILTGISTVEH